jgi:NDP-sugar pyrophosphorylase family protein
MKLHSFCACGRVRDKAYPLTENFPKPLLKVGEKTILDWLMDDVKELLTIYCHQ